MKIVVTTTRLLVRLGITAAALLLSQQVMALGTDAGTTVSNQATVSYDVGTATQTPIESDPLGNSTPGAGNPTEFLVDRRVSFTLIETSGAQTTPVAPGETGRKIPVLKGPQEPPLPPSRDRIKEVSAWKVENSDDFKKATELLLDPKQASTLKLVAIDKLRAAPPADVVPVLEAFLAAPAPPGGAFTKPTAIKVLVDFDHPLADAALGRIAKATDDERIQIALSALVPELGAK